MLCFAFGHTSGRDIDSIIDIDISILDLLLALGAKYQEYFDCSIRVFSEIKDGTLRKVPPCLAFCQGLTPNNCACMDYTSHNSHYL